MEPKSARAGSETEYSNFFTRYHLKLLPKCITRFANTIITKLPSSVVVLLLSTAHKVNYVQALRRFHSFKGKRVLE